MRKTEKGYQYSKQRIKRTVTAGTGLATQIGNRITR